MAEGAVADVMEEAGHPQRLLRQRRGGEVGVDLAQGRVEVPQPLAGQVHGAERVLQPRVLGGGEDPPGALQLVNPAQPLQPGRVEQVLLDCGDGHACMSARFDQGICRRMSALGEVAPARVPLLGECLRALLLVGMAPHRHELAGAGAAGVGQAQLERAPEGPLRRPHRRR